MVRDADCFITLRMVFVPCMDDWRCWGSLVLSCQSLYQVHFVCSMSSGIVTQPQSPTVLSHVGTTEKVAMGSPKEFWFHADAICNT